MSEWSDTKSNDSILPISGNVKVVLKRPGILKRSLERQWELFLDPYTSSPMFK